MQKIPQKYAPWIGMALMSIFMAFIMTGVVTALNFGGFPSNYISLWMSAFSKMVFIAFGAIMLVRPLVERIVKAVTQ